LVKNLRADSNINLWISSPEDDDDLTLREQSKLLFRHKVKTALHGVWKDPVREISDIG
jgi:hypothetical protein